ncbi:TIGR03905 family TSCPD domain-containing protein [Bacteroidaceae bacterium HV4-6-C5C]|nr:TIGR03905 family TSCPD domain-containing protein [Bacteroidaceae bacterium HV4-6-C5C]
MKYTYNTKGTCSRVIELDVENGIVEKITFIGGCDGNLHALSNLLRGMRVEDVMAKLEGVCCGNRPTSCADQLCQALHEMGF